MNEDLWVVWSWVEPIYERHVVARLATPGWRSAVPVPGSGTKMIWRLHGYHEYFSEPVPWEAVSADPGGA